MLNDFSLANVKIPKTVIIVAILVLAIISGNMITGSFLQGTLTERVEQLEANLTALENENLKTQHLLSLCKNDLNQSNREKEQLANEKQQVLNELEIIRNDLDSCNNELAVKENIISELESTIENLQNNYSSLVESSVKKICCIQQVIDPEIKYYYIDNNTIVCTTDSSKTSFSC